MITMIKEPKTQDIITMAEMKPGEVGYIVQNDQQPRYAGIAVYRINYPEKFIVLALNYKEDLWNTKNSLPVRLLKKGESITVAIHNS